MKARFQAPERAIRLLFWAFSLICLLAAVLMPDRAEMFRGLVRICTQSGQTVKSYFDISYGGFAGTFLNVAIVCAVCAALYSLPGSKPDGVSVLAFFLTAGFCFWGTTALNIWFPFAAVLVYCLVKRTNPGKKGNLFLFSTGLTPLITELLFRWPGEEWHGFTVLGCAMAFAASLVIAFLLAPGLEHSPKMHKSYDLYSAAVPMGFIAFLLRAVLFKVLGGTLPDSVGVGLEDSFWALSNGFCFVVFGLAIVLGLLLGGSFRSYWNLMKDSGYGVDYGAKYGAGTAILNLGIYGLFIVLYYNLIGANWNAATLGCVFCMVCCCFKGSHLRNVWPIMLGYVAASFAAKGLCALLGTEFTFAINAQAIVIGLCFANGLSPIAGRYGWGAGFIAAMGHFALVTSVPLLHGAFLLYNGGFTAAIVCFLFVPLLEEFFRTKEERCACKNGKGQHG